MSAFRFTHFRVSAALATALAFAMLPRHGYAYTADQQQACSNDAFRLCSADIPDVDRITACMIRNKSQLSPECRVYFRSGPEAEPGTAAAAGGPVDIKPSAVRKSGAKPSKAKKPAKPAAT
jgi:hypothetical protein